MDKNQKENQNVLEYKKKIKQYKVNNLLPFSVTVTDIIYKKVNWFYLSINTIICRNLCCCMHKTIWESILFVTIWIIRILLH